MSPEIDPNEYAVVVEKLNKSFQNNHVLVDMDLKVRKGETVAVLGGSGCGKTVFLRHVAGLIRPDSGKVYVFGKDINALDYEGLRELRRRVGMVFQSAALLNSLTVGQNVGLALEELSGKPSSEIRRIVADKLELVGMVGTENLMPEELSGGMKKRVGVARTLATDPELILYDEPTTGLDPLMCDDVDDLMVSMKKKLRVSAILVTHDLITAFRVADRIGMLHGGRLITLGTPDEILKSDNQIVRTFVSRHAPLVREGKRQ